MKRFQRRGGPWIPKRENFKKARDNKMAEKSELRSRKSWGLPTRRPLLILAAVVLAKWQNQARPRGSKGVRKVETGKRRGADSGEGDEADGNRQRI